MDLSLRFCPRDYCYLLALSLFRLARRAVRFVCISALFIVQTILIVSLIGSPFRPVFEPKDLPREFWLQLLACSWWALAARQMIGIIALLAVLEKTPKENKILSRYYRGLHLRLLRFGNNGICFWFAASRNRRDFRCSCNCSWPCSTEYARRCLSGLSLSVEKPYDVGDAILLEGGVEGDVIQKPAFRRTSGILRTMSSSFRTALWQKCGFKTNSALSARHNGSLIVAVDIRNEPEFATEIRKDAAMACPAILEKPLPLIAVNALESDRVTYEISFSTSSIASAGEARSQIFRQLYKRLRPGPCIYRMHFQSIFFWKKIISIGYPCSSP